MNRSKQKRIKQLKNDFTKTITEKGLITGQHEVCGNIIIGFDSTSSQLVFVKQNNKSDFNITIPVDTIVNCKFEKAYAESDSQASALEKIKLVLTTKGKQQKDESLILFDSDDKMQLDGELQLGEKWAKIIQGAI